MVKLGSNGFLKEVIPQECSRDQQDLRKQRKKDILSFEDLKRCKVLWEPQAGAGEIVHLVWKDGDGVLMAVQWPGHARSGKEHLCYIVAMLQ